MSILILSPKVKDYCDKVVSVEHFRLPTIEKAESET